MDTPTPPGTAFDPAATRTLRNGLALSQLGVGCAPFGHLNERTSDASVLQAFTHLYENGQRYFDVAPFYGMGLAEHRLGMCLRSVDRRSIVLSTKVGRLIDPLAGGASAAQAGASGGKYPFDFHYDYSYDATMRSLEMSMARLGTNAIDIVLIHDVNQRWQGDLLEQRYAEAMQGAYRALESLRAQGTIKALGVGVNDWSILERFAGDGDFDVFMLAGRYTLLDHTAEQSFLPLCEKKGIGVLMAAPFNSGILATGSIPGATYFYQTAEADIVERVRRIEAICTRHKVALAAAALQFPLRNRAITSVVTGMRDLNEARSNLAHMRTPLPPAFWDDLERELTVPR
jgi:D-threo-aldose 1-dehydrogenase